MRWCVWVCLLAPLALFAKVRILTFHYNRPDFLEYQMRAFQKYLLDDYEVIVFNDAKDAGNECAIRSFCEEHGILCVRFEPEWHLVRSVERLDHRDGRYGRKRTAFFSSRLMRASSIGGDCCSMQRSPLPCDSVCLGSLWV